MTFVKLCTKKISRLNTQWAFRPPLNLTLARATADGKYSASFGHYTLTYLLLFGLLGHAVTASNFACGRDVACRLHDVCATPHLFTLCPSHIFLRCSRVCGNRQGLIRKYELMMCRQCFRERANQIGFQKVNYPPTKMLVCIYSLRVFLSSYQAVVYSFFSMQY